MINSTERKINFQSYLNKLKYNSKLVESKFFLISNCVFKMFWSIFLKLIIIRFFNLITCMTIHNNLYKFFINLKYNFDFILWEIIYSNDKKYKNLSYFLSFYYILKKIEKDNILIIFYTKYYNSILYILSFFNMSNNNIYFLNCNFLFSFLSDLFFNIAILKNKFIFNWFFFFFNNLNLYYKFKLNYSLFFFCNFNYYLINLRWNKYQEFYSLMYFSEYKFFFTENYKNQLKKVIKTFHYI